MNTMTTHTTRPKRAHRHLARRRVRAAALELRRPVLVDRRLVTVEKHHRPVQGVIVGSLR